MDDDYKTLDKTAEGIYREKGSRFLAFGYPVCHEKDVGKIISHLKKKYHNARHHCYAYRMGLTSEIYRMVDDGEPSGTAGRPIYHVLLSKELTNTLIVVVRYFGGVLLGKNRLVYAYKTAALNMLENAHIKVNYVDDVYYVTFPYQQMNDVMQILKVEKMMPVHPIYENKCSFYTRVRKSHASGVMEKFEHIDGLEYKVIDHIP